MINIVFILLVTYVKFEIYCNPAFGVVEGIDSSEQDLCSIGDNGSGPHNYTN